MSNVGYATLQIIPSAQGFAAAVSGQVSGAMVAAGAAGGRDGGKAAGAGLLAGIKGFAGPIAAITGGLFVFEFLKDTLTDSVKLASDLNEQANVLKVTFGESATQIERFADAGPKALGMSKIAAQEAAAMFGIFGKMAGLTGDDLVKFSTDLTRLSVDIASFRNAKPAEVMEALGAALRGEAEPMRRFGVLLDDATLRNEALQLGLIKTTKEALTPQQKVLAANAVIMKQTADAQGDFARTSDGLANRQRILSAQWEDIKTKLGAQLLPAVTQLAIGLGKLLDIGLEMANKFHLSKLFGESGSSVGTLLAPMNDLMPLLRELGSAVSERIAWFAQIWREDVMPVMAELGQKAAPIVQGLHDALKAFLEFAIPFTQKLTEAMKFLWDNGLGTVVLTTVKFVVGTLIDVIQGLLRIIQGVFQVLTGLFTGDWSKLWEGAKNIFGGAWDAVAAQFKNTIAIVTQHFGDLPGKVSGFVRDVVGWVKRMGSDALSAIADLPGRFLSFAGNVIDGFVQGIKNRAHAVIDAMKQYVLDKLPDFVKDFFGIHSPSRMFRDFGSFLMQGLALGIKDDAASVMRAVRSVAEGIASTDMSLPVPAGGVTGALAAASGTHRTLNYYAAPGAGFSDEEDLFAAADRTRMVW